MAYAIMIDWHEEFKNNPDKWSNEGQRVAIRCLEDEEHKYHRQIKEYLEIDENEKYPEDRVYENFEPMMNYGYKLELEPTDEKILKVILNTNCTV